MQDMQEAQVWFLRWEDSNPIQCYCLGNPMARAAWQATVHMVAELDMSEHTHTHVFQVLL